MSRDHPENDPPENDELSISKSEAKRRMHAMQQLASDIADLPKRELEEIALPDGWHDEIDLLARMKPSGARNRQLRHFAKLLDGREEITEALRARVESRRSGRATETHRHHQIEQWRDRLLAEGDSAVDALVGAIPAVERHAVRRLLGKIDAAAPDQKPRLQRQLFRLLRESMETSTTS